MLRVLIERSGYDRHVMRIAYLIWLWMYYISLKTGRRKFSLEELFNIVLYKNITPLYSALSLLRKLDVVRYDSLSGLYEFTGKEPPLSPVVLAERRREIE